MERPIEAITGCADAHRRMRDQIRALSAVDVRQPSLLPGWSIGHLLTHLARNADSAVRRLDAAARGELVDQYPGGSAGRAAEIEEGAARDADELIDDVIRASGAIDAAFAVFDDDHWGRPSRHGSGFVHPVAVLPFRRWREVEVHLVDLGRGYTVADWPIGLVDMWLPDALSQAADRTDKNQLLGWLLRRADPPTLDPY